MAQRLNIKDYLRESYMFNNRAVGALLIMGVLIATVLMRLIVLQVIHHEQLSTLSIKNRINIMPLPPTRGLIFDRNGILLAQNVPSYSLEITPESVPDLDATLHDLELLIDISATDEQRFRERLHKHKQFESIPLKFRLSEREVARIAVNRYQLPGVEIEARLVRDYPLGALMVPVVGYVGRINEQELKRIDTTAYSGTGHIGKLGVEKYYENLLHGKVGFQQVETNAQGRILRVLARNSPTSGNNIYLTLDTRLQRTAVNALGDHRGAAVALDPKNGEVLALASTPGFDPNQFVNGIDQKTYQRLENSPNHPLFNRALRGQYPPGSTIKPFIGLAGLETNKINSTSWVFCPGWYTLRGGKRRYRDWKHNGHGVTSLRKAVVESCDVFFYDLAFTLGIDVIHQFLSEFGFGRPTGIDLSGELPGLLPSREWKQATHKEPWYVGETLITGIGQGFTLATPLQLAMATAILANRGIPMQPHVIYASQPPNSNELKIVPPQQLAAIPITRAANWEYIIRSMVEVIHSRRGTAHSISSGQKFTIAGKTGTAQVFGIKQDEKYVKEDVALKLRDHALFVAFAPARQPRIAVAVVVENGGSGGSVAAPIAKTIIDEYMNRAAAS